MQRVTLFIELLDDEATQVIAAISQTDVRFGSLKLDELLDMNMSVASAPPHPDAAILHSARSDGACYAGDAVFDVHRKNAPR